MAVRASKSVTAFAGLLGIVSMLAGCGSGSESAADDALESGVQGDELFVEVQVPDVLNSANINNLQAQFSYGATTFDLQDQGTRFFADIKTGVRDPSVAWQLQFIEVYQGQALVLMQSDVMPMLSATATTLLIDSGQFSRPDDDLDGDSNLDERNADAEPFDSFSTVANPLGQSGSALSTLAIEVNLEGLVNTANDNLWVTTTIDGQIVNLRPLGGALFSGAINYSTANVSRSVSAEVNVGNRNLVARWTGNVLTEAGTNTLALAADDFNTDIDSDGDGLSNLAEVEISQTTSSLVNVFDIDRIAPQNAPQLDGSLDEDVWRTRMSSSPATIQGNGGLWIDKLLKTTPSNSLQSGDPTHEWTAVHDGINLYLAIRIIDEVVVRDSGAQQWQDDSVEIFIDADNSRLSAYDTVNDYQLIFTAPQGENAGTVTAGQNSAPIPVGIDFSISSTGFDDGVASGWSAGDANLPSVSTGYIVEVSVPLVEIGIADQAIIGLDVHINDDDDGGIRDSKWNWAWSRQPDLHWQDPTLFGAARFR